MMSAPAPMKEETQGSGGRKNPSTTRQAEQGLRCPRCDSPNTKFCYYNNYSLSQPRHFCKTCRRYWTKGGALRNVPIGGGCRKNKKLKSSSRLSSTDGGFSLSSLDFHSAASGLPFPGLNPHPPPFNLEGTSASLVNLGLNYPFNGGMSSMNVHSSLASSIESLSCINQDLHCKLQQQRLATLFGEDSNSTSLKDNATVSGVHVVESQSQSQRLAQPFLFQDLEISKPEEIFPVGGVNLTRDTSTEWFFGTSSYATPTPTTSGRGNGNNGNDNDNGSNWSGVRGWGDLQQQYNALP